MFNENPQRWFKFIKRANNTIRHQEKLVNALERTQQERDLLQDELQLAEDQNRAAERPGDEEETYRDEEGQAGPPMRTLPPRVSQGNSQTISGDHPIRTPSVDQESSSLDEQDHIQNLNRPSSRPVSTTLGNAGFRPKPTMPNPDKFNGDPKDLNRLLWAGRQDHGHLCQESTHRHSI